MQKEEYCPEAYQAIMDLLRPIDVAQVREGR